MRTAPLLALTLAGCLFVTEADRLSLTDVDGDGVVAADDCDDTAPQVSPDLPERCNGLDDDCDGLVDEDLYADVDGDGFGDADASTGACLAWWVPRAGDCDDTDPTRYPGAPERCDGHDNACDPAWTLADEAGTVDWQPLGGTVESLSERFATRDAAVPWAIPGSGTLTFCGDVASYRVAVHAPNPVDYLEIRGVPLDLDGETLQPVLDGGPTAPALDLALDDDAGMHVTIEIRDLVFRGSNASNEAGPGAALRVANALQLLVSDTVFADNVASHDGGAVAVDFVDALQFDRCTFQNNHSTRSGGAISAINADKLSIFDSVFTANSADGNGGAIRFDHRPGAQDRPELRIRNSRIVGNFAGSFGGGIASVGEEAKLYLVGSRIEANRADTGGGVAVEASLACGVTDRETPPDEPPGFFDNFAAKHGGGIAITGTAPLSSVFSYGCVTDGNTHDDKEFYWNRHPDLSIPNTAGPGIRTYNARGDDWTCEVLRGNHCHGEVAADPGNPT